MSSPSRFRLAATLAPVIICILALSAGAAAATGGGAIHSVASPTGDLGNAPGAVSPLTSAIASLDQAQGPAHGVPLTCTVESGTAASCGPAAPAVDPTTGGSGWVNITTRVVPLPSPRLTTMVWDPSDGYILLYGATVTTSNSTSQLKDTWSYANGTWTNLTNHVTGGPPPTPVSPVMTYDPWTSEVILFGGTSLLSENLSLTWTYHADVWTNITATAGTAPSPRWLPIFVPDVASHQMILYGGEAPATDAGLTSTWLFSGTSWSNITGSVGNSPPRLQFAGGAYDPAESGIIVVGSNIAGPPYLGGTYLFSGGIWHNLTPNETGGVPLLDIPGIGYDPATQSLIAVASIEFLPGTGVQAYYPVEWQFQDGNWTNVTASAAVPGSGSGATVTAGPGGTLFMFGGAYVEAGNTGLSQWMYAYGPGPSSASVTASATAADVGTTINFTGAFTGGLAPFVTNLTFGDGQYASGVTSATHAFTTPGTYPVKFTVTDLEGRSVSGAMSVTVNATPSALVIHQSPSAPTTTAPVNFTATVSGGTGPFSSAWTLGDGGTATTAVVQHTYAAGTFTVTLELTDADHRTVNATLQVTVTTPSSPPGSSHSSTGYALYLGIGVVVAIVVVVAVLLLLRRKPPASAPPPTVGGEPVPPGASSGSPPPAPPS
jgi:PKD repeat protein